MAQAILATAGVTKNFDGLVAVNNVTLEVFEGQTTGIMGPNGAGKSTFFNLLTGYYRPQSGRVLFRGSDITRMHPHARVILGIARTFQLVSVFDSMTVLENMMLARVRHGADYRSKLRFFFRNVHYRALEEESLRSLEVLGIADKSEVKTSDMSYGEKRELEIALALSLHPQVLLLDEPFAGLSLVDIAHISQVINSIKGQFTIVIIEHKISKLMDLVDALCVFNEGRMICQGDPQTVICDPEVRQCYWGKEEMACF